MSRLWLQVFQNVPKNFKKLRQDFSNKRKVLLTFGQVPKVFFSKHFPFLCILITDYFGASILQPLLKYLNKKKIKVTFLGTGTSQGIPVIGCNCDVCQSKNPKDNRLRVSILIQYLGTSIVIDVGPDFRQQMLRANVNDLDALLITHEHNDHVAGMDDVRPFNFKYWKDMPVYATEQVQEQLKKRFSYAFAKNPYPGSPMIQLLTIDKENDFEVAGIKIKPIEVMHGKLPVLGFRIENFVYLTDVKTISEEEKEKAKNAKVLVMSALHRREHHSHLSLHQSLELIEELSPERAYLTHLSHQMGKHDEVSKLLPNHIALAFDGLQLSI